MDIMKRSDIDLAVYGGDTIEEGIVIYEKV